MSVNKTSRKYIERKFPPELYVTFFVFSVGYGFFCYIEFSTSYKMLTFLLWTALVVGYLVYKYVSDRLYKVSSDRDGVYWEDIRASGDRAVHIPYDIITDVDLTRGTANTRLEWIEISYDDKIVEIHIPSFVEESLKNFLKELYARKPEVFSEDVIEYMNGWERPL